MKNNSAVSEEDSMLLPEALPPRAWAGVLGGLSNLQKPGPQRELLSVCATSPVYPQAVSCPACCRFLTLPPTVWEEGRRSIPLQPPPQYPTVLPLYPARIGQPGPLFRLHTWGMKDQEVSDF